MRNENTVFSFFDINMTINALCKHFNISKSRVIEYLHSLDVNSYSALRFIAEFHIDLIGTQVDNVLITCKHVNTAHDNLESLRKFGLLNLKDGLTFDTLLRKFLCQNSILIDVDRKILIYKDHSLFLFEYMEDCRKCYYGKCSHQKFKWDGTVDVPHKNIWCEHRNNIIPLCVKLYSHKSELEVHIGGNESKVNNYSCVKFYPEILLTIENVINKTFKDKISLCSKWESLQKKRFYVLEFNVDIKSFEYINTQETFENTYYFEEYLESCGLQLADIDMGIVPSCFFSNIFLVNNSLDFIIGNSAKSYGQLLPETKVQFEDLQITQQII